MNIKHLYKNPCSGFLFRTGFVSNRSSEFNT